MKLNEIKEWTIKGFGLIRIIKKAEDEYTVRATYSSLGLALDYDSAHRLATKIVTKHLERRKLKKQHALNAAVQMLNEVTDDANNFEEFGLFS